MQSSLKEKKEKNVDIYTYISDLPMYFLNLYLTFKDCVSECSTENGQVHLRLCGQTEGQMCISLEARS